MPGGQHGAEGVDHIAEAVDGEQDAEQLGDVAGPEREVADQQQVQPEQQQAGVPDVAERLDRRERLRLQLFRRGTTAGRRSLPSSRGTATSWLMATMNTTAKATRITAANIERLLLTGLNTRYSAHPTTMSRTITRYRLDDAQPEQPLDSVMSLAVCAASPGVTSPLTATKIAEDGERGQEQQADSGGEAGAADRDGLGRCRWCRRGLSSRSLSSPLLFAALGWPWCRP